MCDYEKYDWCDIVQVPAGELQDRFVRQKERTNQMRRSSAGTVDILLASRVESFSLDKVRPITAKVGILPSPRLGDVVHASLYIIVPSKL